MLFKRNLILGSLLAGALLCPICPEVAKAEEAPVAPVPEKVAPTVQEAAPAPAPKPGRSTRSSRPSSKKTDPSPPVQVMGSGDPLPTIGVGEAKGSVNLKVERLDDDQVELKGGGKFIKGPKVEKDTQSQETIRYVYVSRGAWLVRAFQPYLDQIAIEVAKSQNKEIFVDFTETLRTFSYLCVLLASDDGSKDMLKAIAKAISVHRQAVSTLSINWTGKDEAVKKLISQYIETTYLKGVDEAGVRIPAGELSKSEYRSAQEALLEAKEKESSGFKSIDGLLPKFGGSKP